MPELEFTGERLVPGQVDADLLNEHMARYRFAARLARGKRVLDVASGAGYGSAELARWAETVVGLDISEEAVAAARGSYAAENLSFVCAPAQATGLEAGSFDLVVAFEVIEHLEDWAALLEEARRLLGEGGQLIVSTPNKAVYAEARRLTGPNPYHVHEFEYEEFCDALKAVFPSVTMFLQNHVGAVTLAPVGGSTVVIGELEKSEAAARPEESYFFVAVCAMCAQTGSPTYVYVPATANLLREREHHVVKLEGEVAQKDAWLEELKEKHAALNEAHGAQLVELKQKAEWALGLERELEGVRARVVALQAELEEHQRGAAEVAAGYEKKVGELEGELAERTRGALEQVAARESVEAELKEKGEELAKCVGLLDAAERTVVERTKWAQSLNERVMELEGKLEAAQTSRWVKLGRRFGVGPDLAK